MVLFLHWWEQIGFYKKVRIKICRLKKDVLVIFILQEIRHFNLFDKNCTQENMKCYIQHEEVSSE